MIHILGLRIFPKSFGFFLGCSQQDLLEIICGRSLLRKATEICFRISLKNCLCIFPIHVIVSYSLRNYEVTPGVCPRPIPQEICLANLSILSLQNPWGGICHEKTISSNLAKISRPKTKIFWGISPKTPLLFWRYFVKVRYQTICEEQLSTKQTSNGNVFQTNSKGNLYQRVFEKNMPTKKKDKSLRTNLKRKLFPRNCSKHFSTQNYLEKFYQGNSEETFPAKIKFEEQSLPKHLSQETFPYQTNWRNISTKKHLKRNLYQKEWRNISTKISKKNITRNMAKIGTDEIWWNNAFLLNFISFDFCSSHVENNLIFLGGDFSWNCFW